MKIEAALTCIEEIFSDRPTVRYTLGGEGLYVPSRISDIRRALEAAHLNPGEHVLDLGSGDGRVVCVAAAMGGRATGVEADETLYRQSLEALEKLNQTVGHLEIELIRGDILDCSFGEADLIFYYAGGNVRSQNEIYAKLERELHPGARLIVFRTTRNPGLGLELSPDSRAPDFYIYSS